MILRAVLVLTYAVPCATLLPRRSIGLPGMPPFVAALLLFMAALLLFMAAVLLFMATAPLFMAAVRLFL